MSTRSTTHFRSGGVTQAIVYKHPDGYPSAMRPCFDDFFATLEAHTDDHRYDHPAYLAAKWVTFLAHYYTFETGKRTDWAAWKETAGTDPWPSTWLNFLSVGVVLADPGDIEYRYLVECDQQDESGRPVVRCERPDGAAVHEEGF